MPPTFLLIFVGGPLLVLASLVALVSFIVDPGRQRLWRHIFRAVGAMGGALVGFVIAGLVAVIGANAGFDANRPEIVAAITVLVAIPLVCGVTAALLTGRIIWLGHLAFRWLAQEIGYAGRP